MIDLDAIKASGANSDERSLAILRLHDWREWVAVTDALCADLLRDGVSSGEFERFARGTCQPAI